MQEKIRSWTRFIPLSYFLHYTWQDRNKDKKIIYSLDPAEVAGDLPNAEATAQQKHGDIDVFVLGRGDGELPWNVVRLTKLLLLKLCFGMENSSKQGSKNSIRENAWSNLNIKMLGRQGYIMQFSE